MIPNESDTVTPTDAEQAWRDDYRNMSEAELDELGSLAGVATPRTFATTLDGVERISEDMARDFPDQLREADISTDLRDFDSDAARRAKYADMARRVNSEFAG